MNLELYPTSEILLKTNKKIDILVDSHAHLLSVYEYDKDIATRLLSYKNCCILDVCIEPMDWHKRMALFSHIPNVFFSIGIHPCHYSQANLLEASQYIQKYASQAHAIGESGIDWFYTPHNANIQYSFFEMQLNIAQQHNKPIIIHSRNSQDLHHNAIDDVIRIIKQKNYTAGGVMHCFSGTYEQAKKCMDLGFYISFAGNISYTSAQNLQEVVKKIPDTHLLLETDAPYLLHKQSSSHQAKFYKHLKKQSQNSSQNSTDSVQKKGRHNHLFYLPFLYNTVSTLRNTSVSNIIHTVYSNLCKMLQIT